MSSNWIDRMNNLEVTPPEKGWDKVVVALDESLNGLEFHARLYDSAFTPPSTVWTEIENELDADAAPVIPIKKKNLRPVFIRYAAAACIIGLVTFGAIRFFGKPSENITNTPVSNTVNPENKETPVVAAPPEHTPIAEEQQAQVQKDEAALEQSKQTYARLDLSRKSSYSKLYKSPAQLTSFVSETTTKQPEIQYSHRAAVNDSPVEEADRYVMYRDTDGRFIRISKKLAELYCCVSGEQQDEKCTNQLKQWREKIAASPFNPSPDNFMDILDLINSIQDNRN